MSTAGVHSARVLGALASVQVGLADARELSWTTSDDEARKALAVAYRLQASSRVTYLALLVEAAGRDDKSGGRCAVAGLAGSQRVSDARVRAELREARTVDPHQNSLRNTVHDAIRAATGLGQQLRHQGQPEARAG